MSNFLQSFFLGKTHIVKTVDRMGTIHKAPNFLGTGKALCAVLEHGDTLENWVTVNAAKCLRLKK